MQALLTDQLRLVALVGFCGVLWSLESIVPLYQYQSSRVRHALPNVALTVILVLMNLVIVTPHMHKTHHSRDQRETDSNYSNIFSFWDRLFSTYTAEIDFRTLRYGLDGFDVRERQTLRGLLKMPFMSYTPTNT